MNRRRPLAGCRFQLSLICLFALTACGQSLSAQDTRLYFFTAANCGPCLQMKPVIDQLKQKGHRVFIVDVNAQPKWADHFRVSQTPTSIIVSDNVIYGRQSGLIQLNRLESAIDKAGQLALAAKQKSSMQPAALNASNQQYNQKAKAANSNAQPTTSRSVSVPTQSRGGESYVSTSSLSPKERAFRATVRLRVEDEEGISHGTGTVVHVNGRHALILTCGHIFRDSRGRGTISVDHGFADRRVMTSRGQLLASDWNSRDVALVACELNQSIEPVPLGGQSLLPRSGDSAFSVGCSHGKAPTLLDCRIKRTARYGLQNDSYMAMKIDTTVQPKDGRSGGGLFDSSGQLIGVCNAAAQDDDEGIYSALENVHWQLAKANLQNLFRTQPASSQKTMVANSSSAVPVSNSNQGEQWVITVKSSTNGQAFQIRNPSRQLMERLAAESSRQSNERYATRPSDMPDMRNVPERSHRQVRGQSPY